MITFIIKNNRNATSLNKAILHRRALLNISWMLYKHKYKVLS